MAEIIVTLAPGADLKAISRQLAEHGVAVEQELEALDIVTGQADPTTLASLRALEGVAAVEESQPVHISPAGPEGTAA